jgi:hypothetical protein
MEWRHNDWPTEKKFKAQPYDGKTMCSVFWDKIGVILVDILERGHTINSTRCMETLKIRIARGLPEKTGKFLLQHDNARPHTRILARGTIAEFGCTVLPHPPYSPNLAPSDFHLFGPMKDGVYEKHFANDGADIVTVKKWISGADSNVYKRGTQALVQQRRKRVQSGGKYVEK